VHSSELNWLAAQEMWFQVCIRPARGPQKMGVANQHLDKREIALDYAMAGGKLSVSGPSPGCRASFATLTVPLTRSASELDANQYDDAHTANGCTVPRYFLRYVAPVETTPRSLTKP
jgi:hypothetical protein